MPILAKRDGTDRGVRDDLDVALLSVATAVPSHKILQSEALAHAQAVFPQLGRLDGLYTSTGIEARYSCVPADWCRAPHGWEERATLFQSHAVDLLERVVAEAIERAGLSVGDIDMVVTNTITGIAVPSLDSLLIDRMAFRADVQRLPIFGFGCGGGVGGLSRAAQLARSRPGANVLFATVELCSLCARPNDASLAMFVSAALFGDGAAAVVLRAAPSSDAPSRCAIRFVGEKQWPGTARVLGWDIRNDGFGMVLAPELPALMRAELAPAVTAFLDRHDLGVTDIAGFLFHAGGRKILEAAESALAIGRSLTRHSWNVMRRYGNMSSATVLFILQNALDAGDCGEQLLAAFGPGFSAYFMVVQLLKRQQPCAPPEPRLPE